MKNKAIPCLILILWGINPIVSAQNNPDILDENKKWSTVEFYWLPNGPHFTTYNKFEGDTTINGISYKKIWEAKDSGASEWSLAGFIRKEENAYFLLNLWGEEGLVYNFDLEVGDTITVNNTIIYSYPVVAEVYDIDSVFIEPLDEYRRRMVMISYPDFYEYWVEGVGSNGGIVRSGCYVAPFTGGGSYMLCEWENGQKIYDNEDFDYCYDSTVGIDDKNENKNVFINISPMPLKEQSIISFNQSYGEIVHLDIFDIYGKKVISKQLRSDEVLVITKSQFAPGIYLVTINSDNRLLSSTKLIVQ